MGHILQLQGFCGIGLSRVSNGDKQFAAVIKFKIISIANSLGIEYRFLSIRTMNDIDDDGVLPQAFWC